jgi:hypothetical protein
MESIDDVTVDVDSVDGDPPYARMVLTLEGDFVSTCEEYLGNDDENDPNYSRLSFEVPRSVAEKLVQQIAPYVSE